MTAHPITQSKRNIFLGSCVFLRHIAKCSTRTGLPCQSGVHYIQVHVHIRTPISRRPRFRVIVEACCSGYACHWKSFICGCGISDIGLRGVRKDVRQQKDGVSAEWPRKPLNLVSLIKDGRLNRVAQQLVLPRDRLHSTLL